ncbi:serine hydrolase [Pontibacter sp. G13]|uniref:serine hydrolase domain-containing protein n=1 Tax=Pontibacter sp. G13 TaxID=3074898 RepID=UPI0028892E69|nr:serine hydrolase [Pontibacter sp. G13]WNJ18491.1 serine hydrolase [Pontibacter sp. G13]
MRPLHGLFVLIFACSPALAQRPPVPQLPVLDQAAAGFNVDSLNALEAKIAETEHRDFTGLVVIKDHQLVIEWYYNTFWRNQILDVRSAGKSITSLLLGVAMQSGLVESLDQDVYSFFPQDKYPTLNPDYRKITLRDLLDMSSGLDADSDDSQTPGHVGHWGAKDDWMAYILSVPLVEKPGTRWVYADLHAALIGAVIEETSGMSLRAFAKEKVFEPLGITQYYWYTNAADQTVAAGTLYLSALDFAKLGVLVAHEGEWAGQQIVQPAYIRQLIDRKAFDLTDYWNLTDSYGMFWYKTQRTIEGKTYDYLWASGRGGNHLIVIPSENMVIALTSTAYGPRYGHNRAYAILGELLKAYQ